MTNKVYILLFLPLIINAQLAFPTAVGYGKNATGGRGQNIYTVTNTNNSGAGSFRQAVLDANANDGGTIVFKTGGTAIVSDPPISIGSNVAGNITVAGETAPGDGFGLLMSSSATYGGVLEVRGSNVIIRHLRVQTQSGTHSQADGIRIHNSQYSGSTVEDVIIDHCSVYWTTDEGIEVGSYSSGIVRDVTIQNTLIAEPMEEGYGALGYKSSSALVLENVTWYGNMWNDVRDRTPSFTAPGSNYEVINNVKYNVYSNTVVFYGNQSDQIGGVIKNNNTVQPQSSRQTFRYNVNTTEAPSQNPNTGSVWDEDYIIINDNSGNPYYDTEWPIYKAASRINTSSTTTPMSSSLVSDYVVDNVGTKLWRSGITNDHDTRVINNYINSTGVHETSRGSILTYDTGTPYADTDTDNMWDVAEIAIWGDITTTNNPIADENADGYTDLEETFFYFTGESTGTPPVTLSNTRATVSGGSINIGGDNAKIYVGN